MILIRMMNLKKLVVEFVRLEAQNLFEGSVTLPKEVLDRSDELFDFITSREDEIMSEVYPDVDNIHPTTGLPRAAFDKFSPLLLPELRNFFQFKSKYGADVSVDVGLYGDDSAYGGWDPDDNRVLINMDHWDRKISKSRGFLKRIINHELAHASDPFTKHPAYDAYHKKYGANFGAPPGPTNPRTGLSAKYEKYAKSQAEYVAHSSTLLEDLKSMFGDDRVKLAAAIKIISQISALSLVDQAHTNNAANRRIYKQYQDIISVEEYEGLFELAQKPEIKAWRTRPTLFKKFLKDLSVGV